jgi:DNA-binding MarR family transcriptional regulator
VSVLAAELDQGGNVATTLRSIVRSMYIHLMRQSTPCACTTLRKAARAVTRFYDAAIERAGMTTTQFAVLRAAERAGTVTMSRVADDLVMDRTSLYRTVAPLLREGWLRCASSDDDARAKCLVITPLGRRRIACAAKEWDAAQARVVAHLGRRRLGRLSTSLLEIAEQVRTWTPEEVA